MYKWIILCGAFIIYMFDALEILLLSMALPAISTDLHISATQAGLLATATLLGMGFGGPVMGSLADSRGRRFALLVCVTIFIVFTSSIFIVPNLWIFIVVRFISGLGLGGVWSVISAFVTENWPAERRSVALTFVLSSYPIGGLVAAQLSKFMLPHWREMFLVAGLTAIIPLLIVIFLFRESEMWQQERDHARTGAGGAVGAPEKTTSSLQEILAQPYLRTTLLASVVATLAFVAFYGSSTWLPSYLKEERGLDADTVATFMTWLNFGMFIGYNVFGVIADKFGKRFALIASMVGAGLLMPLYGVITNDTGLLLLGPAYAFFMTFAGLFGPYLSGIYPTRIRATGSGVCFNVGRGVSAFAPLMFGALAGVASLAAGLVVAGVLFLCGAAVTLLLPREVREHAEPTTDDTPEDITTPQVHPTTATA